MKHVLFDLTMTFVIKHLLNKLLSFYNINQPRQHPQLLAGLSGWVHQKEKDPYVIFGRDTSLAYRLANDPHLHTFHKE